MHHRERKLLNFSSMYQDINKMQDVCKKQVQNIFAYSHIAVERRED
jgi:hypothetical protein